MSPQAQTLYSVALFLALVSLSLWDNRRRRVSQKLRQAVAGVARRKAA